MIDDITILRLLNELNDKEIASEPIRIEQRSEWSAELLKSLFTNAVPHHDAIVEQLGTSDAFYWGDVLLKSTSGKNCINIILSNFGKLVYIDVLPDSDLTDGELNGIEEVLASMGAIVVPEHIAKRPMFEGARWTWLDRYFDYI